MIVFDMNPKAMENLIQAGAKRAGSAREVVESAEIVFTSLPASPDVEAIYLEPGVALARLPRTVALDDYIGGGCGLLTAVHIAERAEIRLGDTVVVQGTGAVGLSAGYDV